MAEVSDGCDVMFVVRRKQRIEVVASSLSQAITIVQPDTYSRASPFPVIVCLRCNIIPVLIRALTRQFTYSVVGGVLS